MYLHLLGKEGFILENTGRFIPSIIGFLSSSGATTNSGMSKWGYKDIKSAMRSILGKIGGPNSTSNAAATWLELSQRTSTRWIVLLPSPIALILGSFV
jgi:hypothetical protein